MLDFLFIAVDEFPTSPILDTLLSDRLEAMLCSADTGVDSDDTEDTISSSPILCDNKGFNNLHRAALFTIVRELTGNDSI